MIRPLITAVVLCLSVSCLSSIAWAAESDAPAGLPPGLGIRLLEVPADRSEDPRANAYIIDHVIPGATIERAVQVSNGTDEPLPVEIVGVSASLQDGWVLDAESPSGSIADWISSSPSSIVIEPRSAVDVLVTIQVPPETSPGERYGAIIAQPPAIERGAVELVSRVGVRVYLSVGGNEPETDFAIDTLTASRLETGEPSVDVGILNTGGRAIDVSGELELQSEDGVVTAGPFQTALPKTLAPRSRGQVTVPLPESLGNGPWIVTATMRSGLIERVAQATIVFPEEVGEVLEPVEADPIEAQRRVLLPLAALLILLAIAALWMLVLWRRRDKEDDEEESDGSASAEAPVGAPPGD